MHFSRSLNYTTNFTANSTGVYLYTDTLDPTIVATGSALPHQTETNKYALQVTGFNASGVVTAPSGWNVSLNGSLNGLSYTSILTHVQGTNANGATVWSGSTFYPVIYLQLVMTSINLNTATRIQVDVYGVE